MNLLRLAEVPCNASLLYLGLTLVLTGPSTADTLDDRDSPTRIEERAEWFYSTRRWPDGTLPAGLRLRAVDQKIEAARSLQESLDNSGRKRGAPPAWRLIGPRPTDIDPTLRVAGRVTALAVDPRNRDVVYLGGAAGGVWKTSDGGQNWLALTDDQPSLAIGSIALDPTNPDTIYVGTGEANYGGDEYFGSGILKSTDAGATWQQIRGPFVELRDPRFGTSAIGSIAVDPSDPSIVLAGAYFLTAEQSFSGIYRSVDGGLTWTLTPVLAGGTPTEIYFSPGGDVIYTAIGFGFGSPSNGVYRSFDHGQTWTSINGIPPDNIPSGMSVGRIELAVDLTDARFETLYATVPGSARTAGLLGLYRSRDAGEHWELLTSQLPSCTGQCWYSNVLRVHPTNSNVLLFGGLYFWVSLDGGLSWIFAFATTNVDFHALAFTNDTPPKLYIGHDGGAWSNEDITQFLTGPYLGLSDTLAITQFYPGLSIDPVDARLGFGGAQDTGAQQYTGTVNWRYVTCGDGGETAIDFENPINVYLSCQRIAVRKSIDGGMTFRSAINGIDTTDRVQFIAPLVMDPTNAMRLYFGTFRVYRTDDGAQNWVAISPELTPDSLTAIAVAPNDPNVVYTGMVGAVAVSQNALDPDPSWQISGSGLPSARSVSQIAVGLIDAQVAFATVGGFSGFSGDTLGHVFETVDGGSTWSDLSANLPNIPVNDVLVDPGRDGTLYIGTDVGVYVTIDGGGDWFPLGSNLPIAPVLSLKLHSSGILRAATHGRSAWDLDLGPTLRHLSGASTTH